MTPSIDQTLHLFADAYSSGHLVLSHLGLAFVLMLRPFFPELVMSTDLLSFEHPSVLLFCLLPNWTLIPILTLLPNFGGFHRTLQRVRLANRGRLLLRTPGPVPFGTCICSYVETILSLTCHVYGPFEFRTSLGTSVFLWLGIKHSHFVQVPKIYANPI